MSDPTPSDDLVEASIQNIDRRDGVRVTVETEVEIRSFAKFLGKTVDISVGGVFVETHEQLDVGTELNLQMWIPEADEYISVPGEVRWHRPPEQAEATSLNGYGLEFIDIGDEMRARLEAIVEQCRPAE